MNEENLRVRARIVSKLYESEGWCYIEAEWFLEREKIIGLIKKAVEDGKTEAAAYAGAELAGFDRALKVPSRYRELYRELEEESMKDGKAKEEENAA